MTPNVKPTQPNASAAGGLHVAWLLGDDPRTITTKDGAKRTVLELRDPRRLSQSLVIWLDGEVGSLAGLQPGTLVQLHIETVRSGRSRGELVANVRREVVEAAFAHARGVKA